LLRYIDGDLSAGESTTVRDHLARCSHCRERLESLSRVWKPGSVVERMKPSPYLWTRLEARIAEYERNWRLFVDVKEYLGALVRPAIYVLLLIIMLVVGNRLGNIPAGAANMDAEQIAEKEIVQIFYLDALEPIPPESIGKAWNLASN
jgi:predicted anti-sigma-YlaC factor YlaD